MISALTIRLLRQLENRSDTIQGWVLWQQQRKVPQIGRTLRTNIIWTNWLVDCMDSVKERSKTPSGKSANEVVLTHDTKCNSEYLDHCKVPPQLLLVPKLGYEVRQLNPLPSAYSQTRTKISRIIILDSMLKWRCIKDPAFFNLPWCLASGGHFAGIVWVDQRERKSGFQEQKRDRRTLDSWITYALWHQATQSCGVVHLKIRYRQISKRAALRHCTH